MCVVDAYDDGIIDDDDFLLLFGSLKSKNPDFPYEDYGPFSLENMDEEECKAEFRVEKNDLPLLAAALQIPDQFRCSQRTVCGGMEGLCMVLRRMAYPCRYSDLIPRFGRAVPVLSMISNHVIDFIFENHAHQITQWNGTMLDPPSLRKYADAVTSKGAPLHNCFGFIDGTLRPVCRPGERQRVLYNGHKRVHALKFQMVALPSGIIANMYGPVGNVFISIGNCCVVFWRILNATLSFCFFVYIKINIAEGKKHDAGMLAESGLLADLQQNGFSPTGQAMCLYGVPAYPLRLHLQGHFGMPYIHHRWRISMLL